MPAIGADYYLSNGHKWLYSPKGSAFLWVTPALQSTIHPLVISFGYLQGYLAEFDYQGTTDYSGKFVACAGRQGDEACD